MKKPTYRVKQRRDGVWCIYLGEFVIAEFTKGTSLDVQNIKSMIEQPTASGSADFTVDDSDFAARVEALERAKYDTDRSSIYD